MLQEQGRKKALVLALSDPSIDPRPQRNLTMLKEEGFDVGIVSFRPSQSFPSVAVSVTIPSFSGRGLGRILYLLTGSGALGGSERGWFYEQICKAFSPLEKEVYDLVLVEDIRLLPFAFKKISFRRIVFDAREYYPNQFKDSWLFRIIRLNHARKICETYLRRCDEVLTVSPGLAQLYEKNFSIQPRLLRSTPKFETVVASRKTEMPIRVVHHGMANRERQLDIMIRAAAGFPDKISLDLYLTGGREISRLRAVSRGIRNVKIINPVPFNKIQEMLSKYDVGITFVPPSFENLQFMLPNKFFEFLQARLALVIGPNKAQEEIVQKYGCGFVAKDFSGAALANLFAEITVENVERAKLGSLEAAMVFNFENESREFREILRSWGTAGPEKEGYT